MKNSCENVLIIAEAGLNHNGSIDIAKNLVDAAKECGADIVKFQTFVLDSLVSEDAPMARYQATNIGKNVTQKEMLSKLLLSFDDFLELASYCRNVGITFLSTPFDIESIRFLNAIQDLWKVPSGEITNYPYLVEMAKTKKDIIMSTGMSTMDEVDQAYSLLRENGAGEIILLHCTTDYPTQMSDVNLKAMISMKDNFGSKVGYSDHTRGIEVPIAAVAMGASIIEKHITLDKEMEGPDHKASLEPTEFALMVEGIRHIEKAIGDGKKHPSESEKKNINVARKSIVAARDIRKGEILTEDSITTKRPGTGISPMRWNSIIGTTAIRDFAVDEIIEI